MRPRLPRRLALICAVALLLWLGWMSVLPEERPGDVPYVPTPMRVVDRMLELAEVDADDLVFDLGSGDGRIVIRAAERFGARARGFELDPLLVRDSRTAAARAGVADRVEFVAGDLFDADLRDATAVTLFLLPTVNLRLRARLLAELEPGTPIVSHMWDMGAWRPDRHEVVEGAAPADLYQWVVPAGAAGVWRVRLRPPSGPAIDVELRLWQRFQDLEGELLHRAGSVVLSGQLRGDRIVVEATRSHAALGSFRLDARVVGTELAGEAVYMAGGQTVAAAVGERRLETVEGVWHVASATASEVEQWSLSLAREGTGWTGLRRRLDTAASTMREAPLPGAPPADDRATGERHMNDVVVWGAGVLFVVPAADGSARRVTYYGLVEGDHMSGFANDGGTLVPWTARRAQDVR